MNTVKNFRLLARTLAEEQVNRIEVGANLHKRHANIEFKVLKFKDNELTIQTIQGKHLSKNYAGLDTLIQRTMQLFQPAVGENVKIIVHPLPFVENPIAEVDPNWLKNKMLETKIKVKDIVEDTGLDETNISAWLNNKRPMSQIVKGLFYYYFQSKTGASAAKAA